MKTRIVSAAAAAALLAAGSAHAQFSIGIAGGHSKSDFHCGGNDAGTAATSCDREGTTGKIWAGYRFAPHWSGELSYVSPGKTNTSFMIGSATIQREIKPAYVGIGLAADTPFGQGPFGIVGRAGLAVSMSKTRDTMPTTSAEYSRDGAINAYEGVGLTWNVTQKARLELDYEHTHSQVNLGGGVKAANGVNMVMLGGSLAF